MTINIALLRGINVGGHNKIKMAELKSMFQSMGFERVQAYIQSGNVVFTSTEDAESLRKRIEHEIEKVFSISVTVVIRTSEELEQIIENCPFSEEVRKEAQASKQVETFYVSMLLQSPSQERIELLKEFASEMDEYHVQDREVYLLLREGVRNSKLANNLFKLNVPSTVRNWKTINKLYTLVKSMEA
ncbi:DUF1697 domain-containing protein [Brevibacillus reuszeri]|uniref:DUF1697 domain-containing protein n=1 Tax=Brevibacillus reuszeri TaxID=54915 RepID=UPI003D1B5FCA